MTDNRPSIRADALHVDELVTRALRGRVRVPAFQRGLRWRDDDVRKLFDSIHRGYPIGTLLMWKRPAKGGTAEFGPVEVAAPDTDDAWWVVDGQQRLTSLVAGLKHPDPSDPSDPFVVYYDLRPPEGSEAFFRPNRTRPASPYSIPLARCFDAADFQEWLFDFVQSTGQRELIERASDLATRIRNYRVPIYVVETDSIEVAKEIFRRTNQAGRGLSAHEVFAALAPADMHADLRPEVIAGRLAGILGPVEPNVVAKAARALVTDDVTGTSSRLNVPDHNTWMRDTERALTAALRFIRDCKVVHTRLLPAGPTPLVTLARFFSRHPQPSDRNLRLLRRWLWRGFFAEALGSDAKTLRRAVVAITDDEDGSVQTLLEQVPKAAADYRLPLEFDARNGMARLAALVMALQNPVAPGRPPESEFEYDGDAVFDWFEAHGARVFARFPPSDKRPATRFITPGVSTAKLREELLAWAAEDSRHPALASHLVDEAAAKALLDGDLGRFVELRQQAVLEAARSVHAALGEPDHTDRPMLQPRAAGG